MPKGGFEIVNFLDPKFRYFPQNNFNWNIPESPSRISKFLNTISSFKRYLRYYLVINLPGLESDAPLRVVEYESVFLCDERAASYHL